ncbi:hypothetical protein INR75_11525 [Zunongwangia sp. SCSIO 43204]|uniref:hypothetical protein n=1 Tax=Zunongwangia sp. SCSIO 43204 TaxID=2779359 RepID=UPI001CA989AD|nr:hypothetical protein [Zunongwangia sp. SCSIO 43204]UAB82860.1 hypothetical protein INR75_11525 [Zunongwangia sp. SCSIO 43204]
MNQLRNLNYTFEEIEILKVLASFPEDRDKALKIIISGLNDYELPRVEDILNKFVEDGIWSTQEMEDGKYKSSFQIDLQDFILNYPNPIPKNIKSDIDVNSVIEKLSCSNLDLTEVHYLTTLLKKDAVAQF